MAERAAADDTHTQSIPDRTPPTTARQSRSRVQQVCVICASPYLVAPALVRSYQTCSPACSTELRCRSQRKRQEASGGGLRAPARGPIVSRPVPREEAEERADIIPVGRGSVDVLCAHCSGLRGCWSTRELPPPGLCWRCLMRRNAGLESGIPLA